jgi:hypothetical protein
MVLQTTALPLGYAAFLVGAILNADRFFDKGKCVRCSGLRQARKKGVKPCVGPGDPLPFFTGWGMVFPRQEG